MGRHSKKNVLVEAALTIFKEYGFHATGINRILEESGVSKKAMYNNFRSKDELILATLRCHDEQFRNNFVRSVERKASTAHDRLLAVFDVAEEWFFSNQFYGCIFINAIAEFSGRSKPIHNICKEYKRMVTDYIEDLAKKINAKDPKELADQLSLLLEGAIVTAQVSEKKESAGRAKKIAELLIRNRRKA